MGAEGKHGISPHHPTIGRSHPPKRSAPDRGESRVSAAVWGRKESVVKPRITLPQGVPILQNGLHGPGGLGCIRRCVATGERRCNPPYHPPTGVPIPQKGFADTGGTWVCPELCGDEGKRCNPLHHPPIGHRYPPKRSVLDRGDSGVCVVVRQRGVALCPAYHPPKQFARPAGRRCFRRCVGPNQGSGLVGWCPFGRPYPPPPPPRGISEGLRCSRRPCNPKPRSHPIGRPYRRAAIEPGGSGHVHRSGAFASPWIPQLGPLAGPYHEGFYPCRQGTCLAPGDPIPYLTFPYPLPYYYPYPYYSVGV